MEQEKSQGMTRKERKKLLVSQLRDLTSEIVTDEDKLREFGERWRSGFHRYSLSNLFLIWGQCPVFTLVAGYNQWRKVGRYVKKGSKAIWIMAPMVSSKYVLRQIVSDTPENEETEGKDEAEKKYISGFFPVHVFDYSQTEGDELDMGNTLVKGNGDLTLEAVSGAFDIPVEVKQGVADGSTDGKKITINRRKNKAQEVACYIHEVAHIMLGHLKKDVSISRDVAELQAESVAYIVCQCVGINNGGSKFYLGRWGGSEGKDKLKESSLKIVSAADKILRKVSPLLGKVEVSQKMKGQAVLF